MLSQSGEAWRAALQFLATALPFLATAMLFLWLQFAAPQCTFPISWENRLQLPNTRGVNNKFWLVMRQTVWVSYLNGHDITGKLR